MKKQRFSFATISDIGRVTLGGDRIGPEMENSFCVGAAAWLNALTPEDRKKVAAALTGAPLGEVDPQ